MEAQRTISVASRRVSSWNLVISFREDMYSHCNLLFTMQREAFYRNRYGLGDALVGFCCRSVVHPSRPGELGPNYSFRYSAQLHQSSGSFASCSSCFRHQQLRLQYYQCSFPFICINLSYILHCSPSFIPPFNPVRTTVYTPYNMLRSFEVALRAPSSAEWRGQFSQMAPVKLQRLSSDRVNMGLRRVIICASLA